MALEGPVSMHEAIEALTQVADAPNQRLAQHSRERSLRVLMVTGAYPTPTRPHWAPFIKSQVESLREAGVQVDVLQPRPGPTPLRYLEAAMRVLWLTRRRDYYDVVHAHYGLWCLIARLQWRTPVVAAFLGDDLLGTPTEDGTLTPLSRLVVRVSQWLCQHVDAVIVKSDEMRRISGCASAMVIPNGVDFDLFRPMPRDQAREALGWRQDAYYILFANDPRIPRKGYSLAVAAVERLRERGLMA